MRNTWTRGATGRLALPAAFGLGVFWLVQRVGAVLRGRLRADADPVFQPRPVPATRTPEQRRIVERVMQCQLVKLGYYAGPVTGTRTDPATMAMLRFARAHRYRWDDGSLVHEIDDAYRERHGLPPGPV